MKANSTRRSGWTVLFLFIASTSLIAQQASKSAGASIFRSKCILCHGSDGTGKTPLGKQLQAADLRSNKVQRLSNAELHKIIENGQANMPAFAGQLNNKEIDEVITYVRHFGTSTKK